MRSSLCASNGPSMARSSATSQRWPEPGTRLGREQAFPPLSGLSTPRTRGRTPSDPDVDVLAAVPDLARPDPHGRDLVATTHRPHPRLRHRQQLRHLDGRHQRLGHAISPGDSMTSGPCTIVMTLFDCMISPTEDTITQL